MNFINRMIAQLFQSPRRFDFYVLLFFIIGVTFNPFFMHGEINFFETGLYLPAINALLQGEFLYQDIFYLRGPVEVYLPAMLMKIFGPHLTVLSSYFYVGNVLCLVLCLLIALELLKTRFSLYLLIPVLVGRTFPRVVFTYWGGMRYAFGLAAVYCMLRFIKSRQTLWMLFAGVLSAISLLTSVEIGVLTFGAAVSGVVFGVFAGFGDKNLWRKYIMHFVIGFFLVVIPWVALASRFGAWDDYTQMVFGVVTNLTTVFNPSFASEHPNGFGQVLMAMLNPFAKNFRHMTPFYLYIVLFVFLVKNLQRRRIEQAHIKLAVLGGYGFLMYVSAFRLIWGAQFEMALQPEKVIYFAFLECSLFWIIQRLGFVDFSAGLKMVNQGTYQRLKNFLCYFCLIALVGSSLGYAVARFSKRFWFAKALRQIMSGEGLAAISPQNNSDWTQVDIERVKGLWIPRDQARELEEVRTFLSKYVDPSETVLMYPDLAVYFFIFDRPFIGRFPMVSLSWITEQWHDEWIQDLRQQPPRYAILQNSLLEERATVYFSNPHNVQKYQDVKKFINGHYEPMQQTSGLTFYRWMR